MNPKERYWEYSKDIEEYRNRLIDLQSMSSSKTMDLWTDRLLKDCELYITLFGLLVAWLSFLYNYASWNRVKYLFIFDIILIFAGIIWAFRLRQIISRSIENYHASRAEMLLNEINELDFEPPRDPELLYSKRLSESRRLVEIRKKKTDDEIEKYKNA